jgi:hypothetical protein
MSATDPRRRSQLAALASDVSWAETLDWASRTAPAREARRRKYEDQIDPSRTLNPVIRARRANKAEKATLRVMSRNGVLAKRRNVCIRLEGRSVVIVMDSGETLRGVLLPLDGDSVRVETADGVSDVLPLPRISRIRSAKGSHTDSSAA